jgi:predicted alpha/beta superfamily hydrolase
MPDFWKVFIICFTTVTLSNGYVLSQTTIAGYVVDAGNSSALEYVNIGIKQKNIGTSSLKNGFFSIRIPAENQNDTLTFSIVGYYEQNILIGKVDFEKDVTIQLVEKSTNLKELVISGEKLVEKKYGIKRRGIVHFTDGMFKKDDSFEIGQVIKLGKRRSQITSVNLHINSSRADSGNFRINFYRFDIEDNGPKERIVGKSIFQRHTIREGWLKFDLKKYNILLKGDVLISVEFIPEHREDIRQILYEVKIGGSSKSFYRKSSLGSWNAPPHHYCLYATAMVDKDAPEDSEEDESVPAFTLKSDNAVEPYSIFVRLPKEYNTSGKKYPVVYHVDGNVYFDAISSSLKRLIKKKKVASDAIVVGIGYQNAYVMDSLRERDYTYPRAVPADSFPVSGGGESFYRFIVMELMPHIEMTYRVDTTNRTLMGHSLGGYFVLFALLKETKDNSVFDNFVAASPSISYYNDYIPKQFRDLRYQEKDNRKTKLYLTIGELEIDEDPTDGFKNFDRILSALEFIQLKSRVYRNMEHMGTAVPSFEDGLEFMLSE